MWAGIKVYATSTIILLILVGPSHMEDFVADEQVQAKFLSVAQGRPGFGQLSHDHCKA